MVLSKTSILKVKIKRALISVSDKTGITELALSLHKLNIEIISTGGTAKLLQENNIPVTEVSEYTGFPEIMDGRVKTLHPKIYGGILGRRTIDLQVMEEHNILPIDLLIVNLYPFQTTVKDPDCDIEKAIENIDIGGPTMIRAAAKNYADVSVIVDSDDYADVIEEINNTGSLSLLKRKSLALKAFAHTAEYDAVITQYLSKQFEGQSFPDSFTLNFKKKQDLRYGENPHQKAAFYTENLAGNSVTVATQLQGKELSFNNIADADTALECVKSFDHTLPACVIVKHANPCGVAVADSMNDAYLKAFHADKTSAFGGIIAFNHIVTATTARTIVESQFAEVIIAPEFDHAALSVFSDKPYVRLLACGKFTSSETGHYDFKKVTGGLLVQDIDSAIISLNNLKTVTKRNPTQQEIHDLLFAWKVVKFVKSNGIVFAKNNQSYGIGAGQMSRILSTKIANIKANEAGLDLHHATMASDAFFPFPDNIESAAELGISAIIQPGGSKRDEDVIKAADNANIAMVFTGIRHFRH